MSAAARGDAKPRRMPSNRDPVALAATAEIFRRALQRADDADATATEAS